MEGHLLAQHGTSSPLQGPNGWSCERRPLGTARTGTKQLVLEIWRKDGPLNKDDLEEERDDLEEDANGDAEKDTAKDVTAKKKPATEATQEGSKVLVKSLKVPVKGMEAKKNKDAQKKPATKAMKAKEKKAQKKPTAKDVTAKKRPATKGSP